MADDAAGRGESPEAEAWACALLAAGSAAGTHGDYAEARERIERAIVIGQSAAPWIPLSGLGYLASLSYQEGDLEEARRRYEAYVAARRTDECRLGLPGPLAMLGHIALLRGDPATARRWFD